MNIEQQSQGVTYQPEFDFPTQAEWARPLGGGEGAIPTAAPTREQQVFAAWKEELNWDERLPEAIADPGNLRRAYRKVKSNGGERKLGIPTVIDRIVQQAFVQVLTPILDPQMSKSSYGFRPNRSAHDAL